LPREVYSVSILVAPWSAMTGLLITVALWVLWATLRYDSRRGSTPTLYCNITQGAATE